MEVKQREAKECSNCHGLVKRNKKYGVFNPYDWNFKYNVCRQCGQELGLQMKFIRQEVIVD